MFFAALGPLIKGDFAAEGKSVNLFLTEDSTLGERAFVGKLYPISAFSVGEPIFKNRKQRTGRKISYRRILKNLFRHARCFVERNRVSVGKINIWL